uniref:DUF4350 domain-containing protein n=1 Tax=Schlesneria paludicola TaxID=360056 RepID=A0A7C2JYL1_9PLAN
MSWELGWDGLVVVGRWTPVTVTFTLPQPDDCRLELSALDAEGHTATFVTTQSFPAGEQRWTGYLQCGRIDSPLSARVLGRDGRVYAESVWRPGQSDQLRPLSKLADRVIVTAGLPPGSEGPHGFDRLSRPAQGLSDAAVHVIARESPALLPTDPRSYDCLHWVVLAGTAPMPEDVSEALRNWVADGGRLIVSLPKDLAAFRSSPLQNWLPVRIGDEPIAVLNLGELERLAGRSIRIPSSGRELVPRLMAEEGVALASSRDDPLLLRAPYGFGEVTVLGLDITQPPLEKWGGLRDFVRNLVEIAPEPTGAATSRTTHRMGQLTSTGISDLASQSQACLDHFPAVDRPSLWWSMLWMLVLLAVVGPLDYVLVHYVIRRPHATWVTLPVWLVAAAVLAAQSSDAWNTTEAHWNQLDVVDVDTRTGRFRAQTWGTHYSPANRRENLKVRGPAHDWTALVSNTDSLRPRLSWSAIPETAFGGMYRPGGTEWGRTEYRVFSDRQQLEGLPVLQWSSRTIAAEWSGEGHAPIVSDLHSTGLGRLTGSLRHELPGELTDWILAAGNRAYRRQAVREIETSLPWPPGETWQVDDSQTYQRELKGVLTRSVVLRDPREGKSGEQYRTAETRYDPLSRDPALVWELLTFHEAAGGSNYTTLANHLLADHDLSRQLQLGRAVLFGRLSAPPVAAVERSGEAVAPTRHDLFVRIVLPVRHTGEVLRVLPRFEK